MTRESELKQQHDYFAVLSLIGTQIKLAHDRSVIMRKKSETN